MLSLFSHREHKWKSKLSVTDLDLQVKIVGQPEASLRKSSKRLYSF